MGAKSTLTISRSRAIGFIEEHLYHLDNTTLAGLVEELNDNLRDRGDYENSLGLHNFYVTDVDRGTE